MELARGGTMKRVGALGGLICGSLGLLACGKGFGTSRLAELESGNAAAVVSAVTAMNAGLDENGGGASPISDEPACATSLRLQPCANQVRQKTYSDCALPDAGVRVSGTAVLQYVDRQNPACDLGQGPAGLGPAIANEESVWSAELSFTRTSGGELKVATRAHRDFRGINFSGGIRLTSTGAVGEYRLDVFGVRRSWVRDGKTVVDVSTQSVAPLEVVQGLARGIREIRRGTLEVSHNLARTVVRLSPSDLLWGSATCCHPTSGTMAIEYLEGRTGRATLEFQGCGRAVLKSTDPQVPDETITLADCK